MKHVQLHSKDLEFSCIRVSVAVAARTAHDLARKQYRKNKRGNCRASLTAIAISVQLWVVENVCGFATTLVQPWGKRGESERGDRGDREVHESDRGDRGDREVHESERGDRGDREVHGARGCSPWWKAMAVPLLPIPMHRWS